MGKYDGITLEEKAKIMRMKALDMAYSSGKIGAHLGGGLSCIEIAAALYDYANIDPDKPEDKNRDRIFWGKAHGVLALYTALWMKGYLSDEELETFEKEGSWLVGHPVRNIEKGIEYSGGSLGMALSVASGCAFYLKKSNKNAKSFVILGDGECEEGAVWEAVLFASNYMLDNLVVIVDMNGLQSDGNIEEVAGLKNIKAMFESFGWYALDALGHDINDMLDKLRFEQPCGMPKVILAHTVKGKGVSFMENSYKWHHGILTETLYGEALKEIKKGNQYE